MMKNRKYIYLRVALLLVFALGTMVSCERDISEDVEFATMSVQSEVFMDGFTGGMDYFPFSGSKQDAFSVDDQVSYKGEVSMRIDVPNADDLDGAYAGAIFKDISGGRDLSNYDALTFWAKGSEAAIVDSFGFGVDFEENKGNTNIRDFRITTNWKKYIIPIPDATKLTVEKGLFAYALGTQMNNGAGFTVWVDELQFEKLGTIGAPRPEIFEGDDLVESSFLGGSYSIGTSEVTFNLGSGHDQTVVASPNYFTYNSTDVDVARVSESGEISIVGIGSATITASLVGVKAAGSLTVNVTGSFEFAPTPILDPNDVISIFSDAYDDVPVDFFNGYWEPYQTTLSQILTIDDNSMISYSNFNFVGNQFSNPTVDATQKSNLHINMFIPDVPANIDFLITIVDFGADGAEGGDDDTKQQVFFDKSIWIANTWITLEFPITMANKNNMGQIIYENINGSSLTNFYLDNIYFY